MSQLSINFMKCKIVNNIEIPGIFSSPFVSKVAATTQPRAKVYTTKKGINQNTIVRYISI